VRSRSWRLALCERSGRRHGRLRWRQIRVQLRTPGWLIRGGLAGPDLQWVRSPAGGPSQ